MVQGIIIELVQGSSWIEHRSFDAWDIVANFFGIVIGVFSLKKFPFI